MARQTFPELEEMRQMREGGASYSEIGAAFGITERTAHRLLTVPGHRVAERTLLKIRRTRSERKAARPVDRSRTGRAAGLSS
jgi:hypothetical protein